jgi:hypothetical protein
MLSSRPTRNEALAWELNDSGEARITIVRQDSWRVRLLSKLFYIPKKRTITLDQVGTEVWNMCNGRTTVGQMIGTLSERYRLNRKEAEVSLLSYLKTLAQKRFIGFMVPGDRMPAAGRRKGRR